MQAIAQTSAAPAAPPQRLERIRFCSRCATTTAEPEPHPLPYGFDRVCGRCGMGVMLSAARRALPDSGAAFLVVTREGSISAVSESAEALVGDEAGLLGMPVTTAVTSPTGDAHLVRSLARAACGDRDVVEIAVSSAAKAGPLGARVTSCGPPRAALLVLERTPR